MIIQNHDGSFVQRSRHSWFSKDKEPHYYAAVPRDLLDEGSTLIERIITFAFDTLNTLHLELRVYDDNE